MGLLAPKTTLKQSSCLKQPTHCIHNSTKFCNKASSHRMLHGTTLYTCTWQHVHLYKCMAENCNHSIADISFNLLFNLHVYGLEHAANEVGSNEERHWVLCACNEDGWGQEFEGARGHEWGSKVGRQSEMGEGSAVMFREVWVRRLDIYRSPEWSVGIGGAWSMCWRKLLDGKQERVGGKKLGLS